MTKILNADLLWQRAGFRNFPLTEGKITYFWLAERRKYSLLIGWARQFYILLVSAFCVQKNNKNFEVFEVLWKFDTLSRVVYTTNTWKLSAAARKEIPKG